MGARWSRLEPNDKGGQAGKSPARSCSSMTGESESHEAAHVRRSTWNSAPETAQRRTQVWDVARIVKALGVAQSVLFPDTDQDVRLSELGIVLADIELLLSDEDRREIIEYARLRARLAEGRARAAQLERDTKGGGQSRCGLRMADALGVLVRRARLARRRDRLRSSHAGILAILVPALITFVSCHTPTAQAGAPAP